MDLVRCFRGAGAKFLRGDKHQVGALEHRHLAGADAARFRRARSEIVDAVIDRDQRVEMINQLVRQRRRQEGPDHRPAEPHGAHPAAQRLHQQHAVDPSRDPRVRQRHHDRRIDEQVRALFAESAGALPPVEDAPADARHVAQLRRPHAGVLEEQHPVPLRGEGGHDLLVPLPDEVPVDRRDAQDVVTVIEGRGSRGAARGVGHGISGRHQRATEGIRS